VFAVTLRSLGLIEVVVFAVLQDGWVLAEAPSVSWNITSIPYDTEGEPPHQVCDVSWWSNDTLIRSFVSGDVRLNAIVADRGRPVFSPDNLLGAVPEHFHGKQRITSAILARVPVTAGAASDRSVASARLRPVEPFRFFVLECERHFRRRLKQWLHVEEDESQEDESAEVWRSREFRSFRLLSLCRSTPEVKLGLFESHLHRAVLTRLEYVCWF